jgi:hypothetical protein
MTEPTTRRAALGALLATPAVVALGASAAMASPPAATAEWDRLLADYYRLRDADENDQKQGALRRAYDQHTAAFPGPPCAAYRANPCFAASCAKVQQAEEAHCNAFDRPRWKAYDAVLEYPAPTLAALVTKIAIAEVEEAGCEDESTPHIFADIRRLAAREA